MHSRRARPTVADVATHAGVSTATAARALGGYGQVGRRTNDAVHAAADELGYHRNALARSVVTGRSMTLGLVVADIANPFFAAVTRGFGDVAGQAGFDVVLMSTGEDPRRVESAVELLLDSRVDALAVTPTSLVAGPMLAWAAAYGPPVIVLDRRLSGLRADSVGIDNVTAAQKAVDALVRLGHSRIALVTGAGTGGSSSSSGAVPGGGGAGTGDRWSVSTGRDRVRGYRRGLSGAGLRADPRLLHVGGFTRESARSATQRLLGLTDRPTAILSTDSTLALGVLHGAARAGAAVPGDVSVVGFDDADWATVVDPGLTVVSQPAHDIGAVAAERLIGRLGGAVRGPARSVRLPAVIIERASWGPPPQHDPSARRPGRRSVSSTRRPGPASTSGPGGPGPRRVEPVGEEPRVGT